MTREVKCNFKLYQNASGCVACIYGHKYIFNKKKNLCVPKQRK